MSQLAHHSPIPSSVRPAPSPGVEVLAEFQGLSITRSAQERVSYLKLTDDAPASLHEALAHCTRVRDRVGGFAGLVVFRAGLEPGQYAIHTQLSGHIGQLVERDWDLSRRLEGFTRVARAVQGLHEIDEYVGVLSPQHVLLNTGGSPHVLGPRILVPGTEDYQAPESVTSGVFDAQTDLYCLGALLHFVLTGCALPRLAPTDEPAALASVAPLGLRRVIRRACAPGRMQRYETVFDLLLDLGRYQDASRVGLGHEVDEVHDQSGMLQVAALYRDHESEPVAAE